VTAAAAGDVVIRMRGVELGYGPRPVLAGVDWNVRVGQLWFLLGPNGAGKTTLLRAILGLLAPRAGSLERDPERAGRERIGFVPQRCELNPALPTTVREFVTLGLVGIPAPRAERAARLDWALAQAGLEGLADASLWSLSGGQRQRALVARALVRRPRFLILDEPTEGLDAPTEEAFLDVVAALHREHGVTVLFVTHRLATAVRHATHVALAEGGTLVVGTRAEVLAHPRAARAFGPALARLAAAGNAA
jgi:ABC-type Mn2+/Zn2+ transport system ATPase subunit